MKINENIKKSLTTTVNYVKGAFGIVLPIVTAVIVSDSTNKLVNKIRYNRKFNYEDAVKAILDSNMFSNAKKEAIQLLKSDMDSGYYHSIIDVVETSMFSSDKIDIIRDINSKEIKDGEES